MDFDSIDERTAFKLGFAQKCFELGLEPEQVQDALEKSAAGAGGGVARALMEGIRRYGPSVGKTLAGSGLLVGGLGHGLAQMGLINAAKDIGGFTIGLGGGLGLLGGAALGYGKARLDEKDVDEDEIKSKELADTYKVYADRLKAQKAYQQYRKARAANF